jgi:TrmH family RNA methyltransferase
MSEKIVSKSNSKIKYITSLHNVKYRKENKQFLAEGYKSLEMALNAGVVKEVYSLKEINGLKDIPNYIVSEEIMEKISSSKTPEGVVFLCDIPNLLGNQLDKVIYLDHVADPGNAGTIIRTALAFGYDAVVFSNDSVDIYNEKVISATKGAIFALPVIKNDLKDIKNGHQIIASTLSEKSISLEDAKAKKPFILVLGNESHGISNEVVEQADMLVKIPIQTMESLNVSIAAGILMYHFK